MTNLIVSTVMGLVKQKVADCLEYQYELHSGVEEKLKQLVFVLNRIEAVAKTADEVDLEKHTELKEWTRELKAAAEEASDVLDEFEYLCLKRQAEGDGAGDELVFCPLSFACLKSFFTRHRHGLFHFFYMYVKRFFQYTDPLESLRSIQIKLDKLASNSDQFRKLVKDRKAIDQEHHMHYSRSRETSSSVAEPQWVERRDVLEEIIKKLLDEEPVSDGNSIPFLPVVAHGGMGKTTLAQHLFNHSNVKSHFEPRMWAYVSQVFDVRTITRRIIKSAAPNVTFSNTEDLEPLQQQLKETLQQKLKEAKSERFLLVLDDVWYDQNKFWMEEEWKKLCSPLAEVGGKGSKILLTSRTPEVKDLPSPLINMIDLEGLKQEECWSIIQTSAFRDHENLRSDQNLVEIGKKIALKAHGSPLAAKALGGILNKELKKGLKEGMYLTHWTNILNKELSNIGVQDNVMPILKLSYLHLPPNLRQCFAYCSLFPKGHTFDVDMLIRMWVAHGYIRCPINGETTEEEIGWSYFDDLLAAGFFTSISRNEVVMHDLMNDLARFVSKDEFLYIEHIGDIPETVRHLSVSTSSHLADLIKKKKKCNFSNLQSLLVISGTAESLLVISGTADEFDDNLFKDLFRQLQRVRVLDLSYCPVKQLPVDIGSLMHLRYLDLSRTEIASLPESFWRLYHLQVLNKSNFRWVEAPLEKLNHLAKLRYLGYSHDVKLSSIKGLKSLQVVTSGLVVEEGRGGEIGNLKALNELREQLVLKDLDYVESGAAAREADLCRKKWLRSLKLYWREFSACSPDMAAEVLEGLQPPSSLEELGIWNYPGMAWPNWMGHTSLNKLEIEDMDGRGGLPCLKELVIARCPKLKALPTLEAATSLNKLRIEDMKQLGEWSGLDDRGWLPYLQELTITGCPKLRALPTLSLTLRKLMIRNVGISTLPGLHDPNIQSSSSSNGIISSSSKLSKLWILDCENLTSLGEGLLQNHQRLIDLETVHIGRCKLLVSLPDRRFREFKSLKRLKIENCPNLTWVAPNQDLDGGLLPPSLAELSLSHLVGETLSRCLQGLTSLQKLTLCSCQSLTPSALEGLRAMASVKQLKIYGCPGLLLETSSTSTADDRKGMVRGPFSLAIEDLEIDDPLMLVKVPVLKSLTTVQYLNIKDAPRLISFSPELENWFLQNGTSLRKLEIWKARELQTLPDLPKSLEYLDIVYTSQEFKKRYERDIGPDWHKIRHIKSIYII